MTRRRLAIVLFGIALVPLIYAGALTWSNQDPIHHLNSISAAIVNEDRPATSADSTTVNLGGDLVEKLTTDESSTDFHWTELSASEADARLASGDTLVVLTVPSTFSSDAVSVGGAAPTTAELSIRTNDGANQIVGNIAATVGAEVTTALSDSVSSKYLDNVYLGISDIHDQVAKAASGAQTLATGISTAYSGSQQLSSGLSDLATGSSQLSDGASQLESGASQASASAVQLAEGASTVAAGSAAISAGLQGLQANYATMTDNERLAAISQLVSASQATQGGASAVAGGAGALADGLGSLSSGAESVAVGASTVASGSASAAAGASTLNSGLQQLDAGGSDLASSLASGAAKIPTYTDDAAKTLSTVAADPITLSTVRENEVPSTGYSLAPYFMTLALWVGGLSFYLMFPALKRKLIDLRRPSFVTALRSYVPGAVMAVAQSILVVLILRFGIGVDAANLPGLFAIAALTSITFNAINQALIALIGPIGRFVALILIVFQLASAGATYPIQTTPGVFQTLHAFLPFTYSVEAFRSLIAGGSIGIAPAVLVLGAWLVAALAVTTIAAGRERRTGLVPAFVN